MPVHQTQYRWVMLALLWLIYAAYGLISRAISPLVTPILHDLHISHTQMGLILGSWQLTFIFVAFIAGTIIDTWGVRKSLLAGVLTIGLSSVLRYFPKGFSSMLGAVALLGAGGPMISVGCPKAISIWFRGRGRGTAVGIYLTGPWIGGIIALGLTNSLVMPLTGFSWRSTFFFYGLLTFAIAVLWWFLARETKLPGGTENPRVFEILVKIIRVRDVQAVLMMGLLTFAIIHGFTNWLPKILETSGLSPISAGFAASIPLVSGIPALLLIPRLIPPHSRGRFLALSSFLTMVTLTWAIATSGNLQLMGLTLFGMVISPFVPILTLIIMDTPEVGARYMGSAGGLFFSVAEIGGFTGPLIMGALVDLTGTFLVGAFFLAGLAGAILALTFLLRPHPKK
jgi:cyanate permease